MSETRVWLIRTAQPGAVYDELFGLLDNTECARAAAIVAPGRQQQFVIAHGAMRQLIGALLGIAPSALRWSFGPHGKPELLETGLHCNLSHSGGLAALAVSTGQPVGVDVQRRREDTDPGRLAMRYYPPEEAYSVICSADPVDRFSQLWSRKEACVKVGGGRLIPALRWPDTGDRVAGPDDSYHVRDLDVPAGFHGAVAAVGTFQLVQGWWEPSMQPVRPQAPDSMVV